MDDGEDLFENCNAVTLAWVWDWLIQSTRRFFYIYTVSFRFLCYQKYIFSFHTISSLCLFLFRVALPSSTQG